MGLPNIKNILHGINQFFRNLIAVESFADVKERVEKQENALKAVSQLQDDIKNHNSSFNKLAQSLDEISRRLNDIDDNITNLRSDTKADISRLDSNIAALGTDVGKMKKGLQEEIGESLIRLRDRCVAKQSSTYEEKMQAKRFHDSIHELGLNGWSDPLYEDIMKL